jgi:hypothetical protein
VPNQGQIEQDLRALVEKAHNQLAAATLVLSRLSGFPLEALGPDGVQQIADAAVARRDAQQSLFQALTQFNAFIADSDFSRNLEPVERTDEALQFDS